MDYSKTYSMFFSSLVKGEIDATVEVAYKIFQRPIIVLDFTYRALSLYPKHLIGESIFDAIYSSKRIPLEMVSEFHDNCYMENVEVHDKPFYLDWGMVKNNPRIIGRFGHQREVQGYIGIVYLEKDFQEEDLELAEIFCKTLSIQLKNYSITQNMNSQLIIPFLEELYSRNIKNQEELEKWLRLLPVKLKSNYCIINAASKNHVNKVVFPYVCNLITELSPYYLSCISGNHITILLSGLNKESYIIQYGNSNIKKILKILYECGFQGGISFCFQDLLEAPLYLQQAQEALKTGREKNIHKDIYEFSEYAPYAIVKNLLEPFLKSVYIHPAIKKIDQYDKENNTEYLNTLFVYLKSFKEKNNTAEKLNIHRNTLNYRIQKIEEIGMIDLNNQELSYYLLTNAYMVT